MALDQVSGDIYEIGGIEGAAFMLNTEGVPSMPLFPFLSSADSSQIIITPYIPDGVTLGPKIETTHGFKWNMSNGHELWITDALDDPFSVQMPDWKSKGYRVLLRMDKGEFPSVDPDDVYRVKKVVVSGDWQSYKFIEQRQEDAYPGTIMSEDIDRSYAIYHKTSGNNKLVDGVLVDDYKIGKAGQWARPKAYLLDGATVVGVINGFWENINNGDGTLTGVKCWHKADVQAGMSGVTFDTVAIDATLGYSNMGGSTLSTASKIFAAGAAQATESGTVDSLTCGNVAPMPAGQIGLASDSTTTPGDVQYDNGTNNGTGVAPTSTDTVAGGTWNTWDISASSIPITTGTYYFVLSRSESSSGADAITYDTGVGGDFNFWRSTDNVVKFNSFSDPLSMSNLAAGGAVSGYLTYTAGGGGVGIVKTSGLNLGMGMGM